MRPRATRAQLHREFRRDAHRQSPLHQVKELARTTAQALMDAKKALTETEAISTRRRLALRTKGLAKAAKKSGRTAGEGPCRPSPSSVRHGRGRRVELGNRLRPQERRVPGHGRRHRTGRAGRQVTSRRCWPPDMGGQVGSPHQADRQDRHHRRAHLGGVPPHGQDRGGHGRVPTIHNARGRRHGQDRRSGRAQGRRRGLLLSRSRCTSPP